MKRLIFAIAAIMVLGCGSSYAQFGGLGKKLKDKVEKKVKDTVDKTVDKAVDKAEKKAKDAVGKTVDKTVDKVVGGASSKVGGVVGDVVDIDGSGTVSSTSGTDVYHWWLEDQKYPELYKSTRCPKGKDSEEYKTQYSIWLNEIGHMYTRLITPMPSWLKAGDKYVPAIEVPVYAWCKYFSEKPSVERLNVLGKAFWLLDNIVLVEFTMDDKNNGIVDSKKGSLMYWPNMYDYRDILEERLEECARQACYNIDPQTLAGYVNARYEVAMKNVKNADLSDKDAYLAAAGNYFEAEAVRHQLLERHPKYDAKSDYARAIKAWDGRWGSTSNDRSMPWYQQEAQLQILMSEPAELPEAEPGISAADMKALTAAAKDFVGEEGFIEFIPTSGWSDYKDTKFPYAVLGKTIYGRAVMNKYGVKVMQKVQINRPKALEMAKAAVATDTVKYTFNGRAPKASIEALRTAKRVTTSTNATGE